MQEKNITLRDNILYCAKELFLENGCEKTSMRDIAKKAQVSLGSVVYHFTSKENLIMEVSDIILKQLRELSFETINLAKNSIEELFLYQLLMQVRFIENPKVERLFNQLLTMSGNKTKPHIYTIERYKNILNEYSLKLSEEEIFIYMQSGKFVEKGFTELKLTQNFQMTYLDLIYLIVETTILPLGISKKTVLEAFENAVEKISKEDIELLKTNKATLV